MSVTEYLNPARECADLADRMEGEFRQKLLEVAQEWLEAGRRGRTGHRPNGIGSL